MRYNVGRRVRESTKFDMNSRSLIKILAAVFATSSLLGEGIDVPGWDLLLMASPMAGEPRTLQAIGRVSRAAPGKEKATVVDFVDRRVPALVGAHPARQLMYARGA